MKAETVISIINQNSAPCDQTEWTMGEDRKLYGADGSIAWAIKGKKSVRLTLANGRNYILKTPSKGIPGWK